MLDVNALLVRHAGQPVYFDTNIFIYVLGNNPRYAPLSLQLLQACADGILVGLTGDASLAELLVKPLQTNDAKGVAIVHELLQGDGAVTLVSHTRTAFERTAQLRAAHGLKMVDALQLATAIEVGAVCMVSNDRQFPQGLGIECLTLD